MEVTIKNRLIRFYRKLLKNDGFTFIEIIIVIGIIIILSGSVGFVAVRYIQQANMAAARTQIESFALALQSYYIDCGTYPTSEQGLEALWEKPVFSPVPKRWNGPYIDKKLPIDPWGNPYDYKMPGPEGLPFGIVSYGADGMPGGDGQNADISSWE